jgi:MraZ protein
MTESADAFFACRSDLPARCQKVRVRVVQDFFQGNALNAVDGKGRLSIPAAYRDVIERRSELRQVVLAPHERSHCLTGYDRRRNVRLQEQIDARFAANFNDERDAAARQIFGLSELVPYDDTGRIVLPPALRDLAEIDRLALFIGSGDYFELWNPQLFLKRNAGNRNAVRIVTRMLEARGDVA